jgi:hypothetical protein
MHQTVLSAVGAAYLSPYSRGQPEAHGAQASRRNERIGLIVPVVLAGPHLVLTHAGNDDGVTLGRFVNLADDVLGQYALAVADSQRGVLLAPVIELFYPVYMPGFSHQLIQLAEDELNVADDGYVDAHVLAYLGGVDIDMDDVGVGGKGAYLGRGPVVEPHADGDNQIGGVNGHVGVGHAVHAQHTVAQGVGLGETAGAQQRGHHRYLCLFHQLLEFIIGFGDNYPPPGDNQGAL